MSIDLANIEDGEKYLDKYVGWQDNKVYRITSVSFEDCDLGGEELGKISVHDPEPIDIVARMMMCQVLDEHYEYESGLHYLKDYATNHYGEDATCFCEFESEELKIVSIREIESTL